MSCCDVQAWGEFKIIFTYAAWDIILWEFISLFWIYALITHAADPRI
jgi:hypothetical protein